MRLHRLLLLLPALLALRARPPAPVSSRLHSDPSGLVALAGIDVSHLRVLSSNEAHDWRAATPSTPPSDIVFSANALDTDQFGTLFYQSAPYIASHRGTVVVLHVNGHIIGSPAILDAVMGDVAILHLLGVSVVLVAGVKQLLDLRIARERRAVHYHEGVRVTDDQTLRDLKELSGYARFEIESALARGFSGKPGNSGISVVSGNFFYSGKPLGVRGGVDYRFSGEVRRIEVENVQRRLEQGDVVLLTSLGYSPSGEVFSVPSELLAAECAAQMRAAKLVFFTDGQVVLDTRSGSPVQSLQLREAQRMLEGRLSGEDSGSAGSVSALMRLVERSVRALLGGVKRAHLIPSTRGALLKELYTNAGAGMLVSRDVYEGIRPATAADVRAVESIIRPLELEGVLVPRSRDQLEKDMADCFVLARDTAVLACGMLKRYGDMCEVCCLAVDPANRKAGRGEILLAYLERRALLLGVTQVFILSTRTMQWFEERGFVEADPAVLPEQRKYDPARGSKVYVKRLGTQRDIDQEEVLWDLA